MIYLDNNSTTPVLPEVLEAMLPCFSESFGNPSSIHACGRIALAHVGGARRLVASLLGCDLAEIVFTSGGTEGDNLALKGIMNPGDHLIVFRRRAQRYTKHVCVAREARMRSDSSEREW